MLKHYRNPARKLRNVGRCADICLCVDQGETVECAPLYFAKLLFSEIVCIENTASLLDGIAL